MKTRNERKSQAHFRRAAEYGFGVDARSLLPARFFEANARGQREWRELMKRVLLPYEGQVPPVWVRDMRVALEDPVFFTSKRAEQLLPVRRVAVGSRADPVVVSDEEDPI